MPEFDEATPFRVTLSRDSGVDAPFGASNADEIDGDWTEEELDALYRQAVEAADAAAEDSAWIDETALESTPDQRRLDGPDSATAEESGDASSTSDEVRADSEPSRVEPLEPRITPRQVVEALLFVGGGPLTGKRLAELLGGESRHERVDELIESLNAMYARQQRPYEVRLGEGGYRLLLRPEFERVRHRVFGLGPKDVRLSHDALELLSLVAYRQPISKEQIDAIGKANSAAVLRQLLRRRLVDLHRGDGDDDAVTYRTTDRFLQLFNLTSLDDLPQIEDFTFR